MKPQALTASYASTTSTQTFSASLPSLPSDPNEQNVQEKTKHLSALRGSATQMQRDINAALTQLMEDDKAAEAGGKLAAKEAQGEEMYGEEDPELDG